MLGGIPFAARYLERAIATKGRQLLGWVLEVSASFFAADLRRMRVFKRRIISPFLTLNYALFLHIALIYFAGFIYIILFVF